MNTKYKRHQKVKLLQAPDPEDVEYHTENLANEEAAQTTPIEAGMLGEINVILQNGTYHVKILDDKGQELAYAPFDEDSLEAAD
ncbi:hypothetical protein CMI48_03985 [Candidatus Pacearchaeota archaeon]|jgi:uncharacterized protein YfaS (alpha-2-macroglobulin family)|nr:hypothetical protein [Candidatus Pacearchaeota archaeon]|tara:strand:+ start:368 stop:619 length:252 start_codon:yes stop_codon:yes gene_type:complete